MACASRRDQENKDTIALSCPRMKKLLVIDNFDSFTYNLVQYFGQSGAACEVIRNNQLSLEEIDISPFDGIVLSPGPCDPDRAGISLSAVKAWEGKTSPIHHQNENLFEGLPNPFSATRYHSLLLAPSTLPTSLTVTAETSDGEIMGIQHKDHPTWGVQFHPESLATESGIIILKNFLQYC
jgi:anthranilate/para-aminobenzoate synthase component II